MSTRGVVLVEVTGNASGARWAAGLCCRQDGRRLLWWSERYQTSKPAKSHTNPKIARTLLWPSPVAHLANHGDIIKTSPGKRAQCPRLPPPVSRRARWQCSCQS
jgi:hypothetical protein